jgi:cytochrome c553
MTSVSSPFAVCRWITALFCLALLSPAWAAEPAPSASARELLNARLLQVGRDSTARNALLADGKARTEFCARCHGEDGISKEPLVPNLSGQNAQYLLDQIERFADGRRKDFIMSPLARQYSREDRVVVAIYYASMSSREQGADPVRVAQGAALYGQRCIACHGPGARGSDQFARLAGQHPAYLQRRLEGFQAASGASLSPMTDIARALNDRQVEQLAAYLSSLP